MFEKMLFKTDDGDTETTTAGVQYATEVNTNDGTEYRVSPDNRVFLSAFISLLI